MEAYPERQYGKTRKTSVAMIALLKGFFWPEISVHIL
jgi:hypothetical protein